MEALIVYIIVGAIAAFIRAALGILEGYTSDSNFVLKWGKVGVTLVVALINGAIIAAYLPIGEVALLVGMLQVFAFVFTMTVGEQKAYGILKNVYDNYKSEN